MGGSPKSSGAEKKRRKLPTGSGPGAGDECPPKFRAVVMGPAPGVIPGTWLDLVLDQTSAPPRVVFTDLATGAVVGSLAAIPDLKVLIDCLKSQVDYRAHVDAVTGGRVDVTVVKQ
jgi:hypothetical protein